MGGEMGTILWARPWGDKRGRRNGLLEHVVKDEPLSVPQDAEHGTLEACAPLAEYPEAHLPKCDRYDVRPA
jgi:hypothetical protein